MDKKSSFLIYLDYNEQFKLLSDEELGKLIRVIMQYEKTGEEPSLDGVLKMAFSFIKTQLDRDREKYEKKCEKNKENARKRWEEKNTNAYERIKRIANNADNDKEKDNDKEEDNDNDVIDNKDIVLAELIKHYEANIGTLFPTTALKLIELRDNIPKELIKKAIDIACVRGIRNMSYIEGIIKDWQGKGYKCLADIECENDNKKETAEEAKARKLKELEEIAI